MGVGDGVGFLIRLPIVLEVRLTIFMSGWILREMRVLLMELVGRKTGLVLDFVCGVRFFLNIVYAFFLAWSMKYCGYLSSWYDSSMNDSSLARYSSLQILRALR